MSPRDLTLIVAATNKMGIGRAGNLPWTGLKNEMAYFARVTKRARPEALNAVIMGRKTWESIPKKFRPLKDRLNVVVSNENPPPDALTVVHSLEEATAFIGSTTVQRKSFVIGGAQIYKAALEMQDTKRILLTRVLDDFECDTFFPVHLSENGETTEWIRRSKEELDAWAGEIVVGGVQTENGTRYKFEMWERK